MNAQACATSDNANAWKQINWQKVAAYVKKTAKSYRKGSTGRQTRQSKKLAVAVDSLFLRQSISRQESDRKQRQ